MGYVQILLPHEYGMVSPGDHYLEAKLNTRTVSNERSERALKITCLPHTLKTYGGEQQQYMVPVNQRDPLL